MFLSDIFEQLAAGELSQHKYGKTGAILTEDYPALITHTNLALMELHKEFPINVKELQIRQHSEISLYVLDILYADSNTESTAAKYIVDTEEQPFLDDVITIDAAYDDNGYPVPINDESLDRSVFMAGFDTIQIPYSVDGLNLFFIYRAQHEKIATDADPLTTKIYIPDSLVEPLLCYIAARCYSALNSPSSNTTSSFYFRKYGMMTKKITEDNTLNEARTITNNKLHQKGFV